MFALYASKRPSSPQPAPAGSSSLFTQLWILSCSKILISDNASQRSSRKNKEKGLDIHPANTQINFRQLKTPKVPPLCAMHIVDIARQSFYLYTNLSLKPSIPRMLYIVKWNHNTPFMNLIFNWKMGSSIQFNSSTILCERQNLIVDSILRFIQYSFYVQRARLDK